MSASIVHEVTALRGSRDFKGAVRLVRERAAELDDDSRLPALLQAFYAATEGGLAAGAHDLATRIDAIDTDVPTVKTFLAAS